MKRHQESIQTSAERKLAGALRSRKLIFKENQHIEGYEVDFWFPDYQLAVEVDGYYHLSESQRKLDLQKDQFLMEKGVLLIRFNNQQIRENLAGCVQEIQRLITKIGTLKNQRPINDQWKAVLKNIRLPKPPSSKKLPKTIEDYFLSIDDEP